jgi:hypothetical protein
VLFEKFLDLRPALLPRQATLLYRCLHTRNFVTRRSAQRPLKNSGSIPRASLATRIDPDTLVEVVRDDGAASIMVRTLKFVLIDQGRGLPEMKKSRVAFRCEYPGYGRSSLRDAWLKLYHYKEIYDVVGRFQEAQVITEWKVAPISAQPQVVWTNLQAIEETSSEGLLEWTLSFFILSSKASGIASAFSLFGRLLSFFHLV